MTIPIDPLLLYITNDGPLTLHCGGLRLCLLGTSKRQIQRTISSAGHQGLLCRLLLLLLMF